VPSATSRPRVAELHRVGVVGGGGGVPGGGGGGGGGGVVAHGPSGVARDTSSTVTVTRTSSSVDATFPELGRPPR